MPRILSLYIRARATQSPLNARRRRIFNIWCNGWEDRDPSGIEPKSWQPTETLLLLEQIFIPVVWHPRAVKSAGINERDHDIELHNVTRRAIGIGISIDARIRPWIDQGIPVFQDCDLLNLDGRHDRVGFRARIRFIRSFVRHKSLSSTPAHDPPDRGGAGLAKLLPVFKQYVGD